MHIKIKDYNGKTIEIDVSDEIIKLYYEEKKRQERERYEKRKHIDSHSLDDYIVTMKAITETLEETYFKRQKIREIMEIVESCSAIQRKRFYLHFICGYTYKEIAKIDNCHISSVHESIKTVIKKIKKKFKKI